jgi:hypothetical protein
MQGKDAGEKKPAHRERVNPSFGRVEETGATINAACLSEKFSLAIISIRSAYITIGLDRDFLRKVSDDDCLRKFLSPKRVIVCFMPSSLFLIGILLTYCN